MKIDFKKASTVTSDDLLTSLKSNLNWGLSKEEAKERLLKDGPNLLSTNKVSAIGIFLRQLKSPFIYLLFGAALISLFLGEARDALFILLFISINTVLGFYQEFKSESTAELLKSFVESQVKVVRGGEKLAIPSRNLCVGDIIELNPGDIVQADIRILGCNNFTVDESILTGESESQPKTFDVLASPPSQIYEASNITFSGSSVVTGSAIGVVIATGADKEASSITKLATESTRVSSFEKGISSFSKFILRTIGATLVLMVVANIIVKGSSVDIPELLLFSIALAVSVIPEALPVVTTFSLSQGANRLAKNKVVVKRLSAIEDLGSISILTTDKTGTITENKMTLVKSLTYKGSDIHYYSALASDFLGKLTHPKDLDSFDSAILSRLTPSDKKKLKGSVRIEQLPFDPERRRTTVLVESKGTRYIIARGAPENILNLCTKLEDKKGIEKWIENEGLNGNRVMAVCYKKVSHKESQKDISALEKGMTFSGILSFEDPLKSTTLEAVKKAKALGIQLKVLTGDRPEVAGAVGVKIGLIENPRDVMTGEQFESLNISQKHEAVEKYHIFARVTPSLKYEVIKLLEEKHEVGFLGEGINDAPALKIANVGIVVQSASDISKEASDIILLNKSLLTIVEGIEEGRTVFANTVKYIKATLASNFGNFYAVAISSLFIPYLPMLPIQILLVNLLSDFPMISIATDNIDPEELRSPRSYDIKEVAGLATFLGFVSTCFDFLTFALFFKLAPSVLQTNWFMESILTELVLIYSIRTKKPFFKSKNASKSIFVLTGVAAATTIALPYLKIGESSFGFSLPQTSHMLIIGLIVVSYFVCTEVAKLSLYKISSKRAAQAA